MSAFHWYMAVMVSLTGGAAGGCAPHGPFGSYLSTVPVGVPWHIMARKAWQLCARCQRKSILSNRLQSGYLLSCFPSEPIELAGNGRISKLHAPPSSRGKVVSQQHTVKLPSPKCDMQHLCWQAADARACGASGYLPLPVFSAEPMMLLKI